MRLFHFQSVSRFALSCCLSSSSSGSMCSETRITPMLMSRRVSSSMSSSASSGSKANNGSLEVMHSVGAVQPAVKSPADGGGALQGADTVSSSSPTTGGPQSGNQKTTSSRTTSSNSTTSGSGTGTGPANPLFKVKRKAPWGAPQLRDSWSIDAMSKSEKENLNERMHREYRYNPFERQRRALKWLGLSIIPSFLLGSCVAYYYHTGNMFWHGDPQFAVNFVRSCDTSPRSKFYPYRFEENDVLPDHIAKYRESQQKVLEAQRVERLEEAAERERLLSAAIHNV